MQNRLESRIMKVPLCKFLAISFSLMLFSCIQDPPVIEKRAIGRSQAGGTTPQPLPGPNPTPVPTPIGGNNSYDQIPTTPVNCPDVKSGDFDHFYIEPETPIVGETITVVARHKSKLASFGGQLKIRSTYKEELSTSDFNTQGGTNSLFYFDYGPVPGGELCLILIDNGRELYSQKISVSAPPKRDQPKGAYKIKTVHQWTCDEQPNWGNELHFKVFDESNQPKSDAKIKISVSAIREAHLKGAEVPAGIENVFGDARTHEFPLDKGAFNGFIFAPVTSNGAGLAILNLYRVEVSDGQHFSDVATRITTGWWDSWNGHNYGCGGKNANSWGHWSYSVEFHWDPQATQWCKVVDDHAGMNSAGGGPNILFDEKNPKECFPIR